MRDRILQLLAMGLQKEVQDARGYNVPWYKVCKESQEYYKVLVEEE